MTLETEQAKTVRMVRPRLLTFELEFLTRILKEKFAGFERELLQLYKAESELEKKLDMERMTALEILETDLESLRKELSEVRAKLSRLHDKMAVYRGLILRFERILEGAKRGRPFIASDLSRKMLALKSEG